MPRQPRIQYKGALYHVFTRGNFRQDLFLSDTDYETFLDLLSFARCRYNFRLFSFCLMKNHYHLMLETPDGNLSRGMQYLNGVYATAFNIQNIRFGHVMHGRYNYRLIESEEYFRNVARYIALNPVASGFVARPGAWKFSSFNAIAGNEPTPDYLDRAGLLAYFSDVPTGIPHSFLEFLGHPSAQNMEFNEDLVFLRPRLSYLFDSLARDVAVVEAVTQWMYTYREVATYLGVSRPAVCKIVSKVNKRV